LDQKGFLMLGELVKKYITDKNLTVAIFANLIKVNKQTIYSWFKSDVKIRALTAERIEDTTRGEITFQSIMGYQRTTPKRRVRSTQLQYPKND
jgi:hypothetical protein